MLGTGPVLASSSQSINRREKAYWVLCLAAGLLTAGLLIFSQTKALAWDEGFHLLAAFLIKTGKTPYLDFCFPQTPLNAYWNAAWLRVFGESWRAVHAIAALLTSGAVFLAADFVYAESRMPRWRLAAALTAALFVGLNRTVVDFGPIAQAYGMCLFLTVAAFRLTLKAAECANPLYPAAAGLLAGAAANCSLLSALAFPVFLVWMLFYQRSGSRIAKAAAFLSGALIPSLPVLWLFAQAPAVAWFNLAGYHAFFRRVKWEGATLHDFEVMVSWIQSAQALFLGLLAVAGLIAIRDNPRQQRAKFYLAAWLSVALSLEAAVAHPTFPQYFVFTIPFLSILATAGFYHVVSRLGCREKPFRAVAVLGVLLALSLAKSIDDERSEFTWPDLEQIAQKVAAAVPPSTTLWADPHIYFLTHRIPPSGMEFPASHKVEVPPALAAALHILPQAELDREVKAGQFGAVETCDDDTEPIKALGLPSLYANQEDVSDCVIYWGLKK
ncbi:MAG TPA: hypothetical protein VKG25_27530 [Bryobacteraceae bacterium]|nr:hypothetical protein [Bryobacteraceae bacterium]